MKKQNVRTFVLLIGTIAFLLFGAVVFDKLESEDEKEDRNRLENLEKGFKNNLNISDEDFEALRKVIIESRSYQAGIQWKFAGAFYFALSVITTIGMYVLMYTLR